MLEELRKWVRAAPFQPFSVELSSGRVLPVPHPDHILVGRGMVAIEDDKGLIDVTSALHITGIHSQISRP